MSQLRTSVARLGVAGTANLLISRRKLRQVLPPVGTVRLRGLAAPFHFRRVSTDRYVLVEVLVADQYACLRGLPDVRTIVDAGANVGTASVFLLNAYPNARLIALEPDAGNFEMLQRNLSYYGPRATAVRQALWHRHERLAIDRGHFRDGGEWSIQVKGGAVGAGDVEGVTLPELMRAHQLESIDILKVDIEGAERFVFERSVTGSLGRIGTIAIELHDDECRRVFFKAIEGVPGRITQHGEVTLWQRGR